DGVLLDNYPLNELVKFHRNYQFLSYAQLQKADIQFTEVYFKLLNQLANGKVNPKKLYGDWEPYQQKINSDSILNHAIIENKIHKSLDEVKPKSEIYLKYKKAFAQFVPIQSFDTLTSQGLLQKKIWINLERTKWLPPSLGKYYGWVNIAEYDLKVVANDEVVAQHKVIVGKKERRTPVLSSS